MTNPTAPTPEPAAGTLATALAIIDSDLFDFRTHVYATGHKVDRDNQERIEAAWATVRAAALASLEPKPTAPPPIDDIGQRAARVMAAMAQAGSEALAEPSEDAAIGLGLAAVMHGVSMMGLGVQAIVGVGKAIAGVTDSLEAISATLHSANMTGWGLGE